MSGTALIPGLVTSGGGGGLGSGWSAYDATTLTPKAPYTDIRVTNLTVTGTAVITSTVTATGGITTAAQAGLVVGPYGAGAGATGEIRLKELAAGGTAYTGFKAPDAITTGGVYTMPAEYPVSNMVLQSTSAGVLSWVTAGGASTALDNLASVAINTTLVSDTTNTDDLGTTGVLWRAVYATAVLASAGSASNPGWSFNGDANTGIYEIAADVPVMVTGGAERMGWNSTGALLPSSLGLFWYSSAFGSGAPDAGLYRQSALNVGICGATAAAGAALNLLEMTAPGVAATNGARLFLVDVAGKTALQVIFQSGSAITLAIEV